MCTYQFVRVLTHALALFVLLLNSLANADQQERFASTSEVGVLQHFDQAQQVLLPVFTVQ